MEERGGGGLSSHVRDRVVLRTTLPFALGRTTQPDTCAMTTLPFALGRTTQPDTCAMKTQPFAWDRTTQPFTWRDITFTCNSRIIIQTFPPPLRLTKRLRGFLGAFKRLCNSRAIHLYSIFSENSLFSPNGIFAH